MQQLVSCTKVDNSYFLKNQEGNRLGCTKLHFWFSYGHSLRVIWAGIACKIYHVLRTPMRNGLPALVGAFPSPSCSRPCVSLPTYSAQCRRRLSRVSKCWWVTTSITLVFGAVIRMSTAGVWWLFASPWLFYSGTRLCWQRLVNAFSFRPHVPFVRADKLTRCALQKLIWLNSPSTTCLTSMDILSKQTLPAPNITILWPKLFCLNQYIAYYLGQMQNACGKTSHHYVVK